MSDASAVSDVDNGDPANVRACDWPVHVTAGLSMAIRSALALMIIARKGKADTAPNSCDFFMVISPPVEFIVFFSQMLAGRYFQN
jgi:hypothetical protein